MPLVPLNRLAPRLQRSVEGLNLELEGVFVSEKPEDQHEVRPLSCVHFSHMYIFLLIQCRVSFSIFNPLLYKCNVCIMSHSVDFCLNS